MQKLCYLLSAINLTNAYVNPWMVDGWLAVSGLSALCIVLAALWMRVAQWFDKPFELGWVHNED